jgi:hypothetical protein
MAPCNYTPIEFNPSDVPTFYLDELFDLDVLCTEEGILINMPID